MNNNDEYKTLRDEMHMLFNRVFLIFGAEIAAVTTLTYKGLEQSDYSSFLLALMAQAILSAGLFLTISLYQNLYSIGSYLIVFYENEVPGWHQRSRHMRSKLQSENLDRPLNWIEKSNEPMIIGYVYIPLVIMPLTFPLLNETFTFDIHLTEWISTILWFTNLIDAMINLYLFSQVKKAYTKGSETWTIRWDKYKEEYKNLSAQELIKILKGQA